MLPVIRCAHVVADDIRRDHVVRALQDQGGHPDVGEVGAVVRGEGDPGEVPGDLRIGAAEAVGQLVAELRPVGVAHDHRGHRARPAEVVAVQRLQQPVDVLGREPADVLAVVDVARRGTDQHQPAEALRLAIGGEHADHRADRVADEHDVRQVERVADLQDVVGVAAQVAVAVGVEGPEVRPAGADLVEQHDAVGGLEGRRDEPPHVLVAAEAVGEQHRRPVRVARRRSRCYGRVRPRAHTVPPIGRSATSRHARSHASQRYRVPRPLRRLHRRQRARRHSDRRDGADESFTPTELLLVAIGACTGIDVATLTARRLSRRSSSCRSRPRRCAMTGATACRTWPSPSGSRSRRGRGDAARELYPAAIPGRRPALHGQQDRRAGTPSLSGSCCPGDPASRSSGALPRRPRRAGCLGQVLLGGRALPA